MEAVLTVTCDIGLHVLGHTTFSDGAKKVVWNVLY
jgi:hypothetical protein